MASLKHRLEGSPEGTLGGIFLYISFVFYGSIKVSTGAIYKWVYFLSAASI
jgi:hypothetical protein